MSVFKASLEAERALGLLVQMSRPSSTLVLQDVLMGNSSLRGEEQNAALPSDFHDAHSAFA